mmetsp:Transcript_9037/g.14501  ORF Transcript_9037/g.14501 Transcript_9037/m.14501 type:complete len:2420 (+) Transcript_9037:89-7348(+)
MADSAETMQTARQTLEVGSDENLGMKLGGPSKTTQSLKTPSKERCSLGAPSAYYFKYVNSTGKKRKNDTSILGDNHTGEISIPGIALDQSIAETSFLSIGDSSSGSEASDLLNKSTLSDTTELTASNFVLAATSRQKLRKLSKQHATSVRKPALNSQSAGDSKSHDGTKPASASEQAPRQRETNTEDIATRKDASHGADADLDEENAHSQATRNCSQATTQTVVAKRSAARREPLEDLINQERQGTDFTDTQGSSHAFHNDMHAPSQATSSFSQETTETVVAKRSPERKSSLRGASPSLRSRISASPRSLRKFTASLKKSRIQRQIQRDEDAKRRLSSGNDTGIFSANADFDTVESKSLNRQRLPPPMTQPSPYSEHFMREFMNSPGAGRLSLDTSKASTTDSSVDQILGVMDDIFGGMQNQSCDKPSAAASKNRDSISTSISTSKSIVRRTSDILGTQDRSLEHAWDNSSEISSVVQNNKSSHLLTSSGKRSQERANVPSDIEFLEQPDSTEQSPSRVPQKQDEEMESPKSNISGGLRLTPRSKRKPTPTGLSSTPRRIVNPRSMDSPARNTRSAKKKQLNDFENTGNISVNPGISLLHMSGPNDPNSPSSEHSPSQPQPATLFNSPIVAETSIAQDGNSNIDITGYSTESDSLKEAGVTSPGLLPASQETSQTSIGSVEKTPPASDYTESETKDDTVSIGDIADILQGRTSTESSALELEKSASLSPVHTGIGATSTNNSSMHKTCQAFSQTPIGSTEKDSPCSEHTSKGSKDDTASIGNIADILGTSGLNESNSGDTALGSFSQTPSDPCLLAYNWGGEEKAPSQQLPFNSLTEDEDASTKCDNQKAEINTQSRIYESKSSVGSPHSPQSTRKEMSQTSIGSVDRAHSDAEYSRDESKDETASIGDLADILGMVKPIDCSTSGEKLSQTTSSTSSPASAKRNTKQSDDTASIGDIAGILDLGSLSQETSYFADSPLPNSSEGERSRVARESGGSGFPAAKGTSLNDSTDTASAGDIADILGMNVSRRSSSSDDSFVESPGQSPTNSRTVLMDTSTRVAEKKPCAQPTFPPQSVSAFEKAIESHSWGKNSSASSPGLLAQTSSASKILMASVGFGCEDTRWKHEDDTAAIMDVKDSVGVSHSEVTDYNHPPRPDLNDSERHASIPSPLRRAPNPTSRENIDSLKSSSNQAIESDSGKTATTSDGSSGCMSQEAVEIPQISRLPEDCDITDEERRECTGTQTARGVNSTESSVQKMTTSYRHSRMESPALASHTGVDETEQDANSCDDRSSTNGTQAKSGDTASISDIADILGSTAPRSPNSSRRQGPVVTEATRSQDCSEEGEQDGEQSSASVGNTLGLQKSVASMSSVLSPFSEPTSPARQDLQACCEEPIDNKYTSLPGSEGQRIEGFTAQDRQDRRSFASLSSITTNQESKVLATDNDIRPLVDVPNTPESRRKRPFKSPMRLTPNSHVKPTPTKIAPSPRRIPNPKRTDSPARSTRSAKRAKSDESFSPSTSSLGQDTFNVNPTLNQTKSLSDQQPFGQTLDKENLSPKSPALRKMKPVGILSSKKRSRYSAPYAANRSFSQRSVAFGSPEAAEYRIGSPSVSLTPMPASKVKQLFAVPRGRGLPNEESPTASEFSSASLEKTVEIEADINLLVDRINVQNMKESPALSPIANVDDPSTAPRKKQCSGIDLLKSPGDSSVLTSDSTSNKDGATVELEIGMERLLENALVEPARDRLGGAGGEPLPDHSTPIGARTAQYAARSSDEFTDEHMPLHGKSQEYSPSESVEMTDAHSIASLNSRTENVHNDLSIHAQKLDFSPTSTRGEVSGIEDEGQTLELENDMTSLLAAVGVTESLQSANGDQQHVDVASFSQGPRQRIQLPSIQGSPQGDLMSDDSLSWKSCSSRKSISSRQFTLSPPTTVEIFGSDENKTERPREEESVLKVDSPAGATNASVETATREHIDLTFNEVTCIAGLGSDVASEPKPLDTPDALVQLRATAANLDSVTIERWSQLLQAVCAEVEKRTEVDGSASVILSKGIEKHPDRFVHLQRILRNEVDSRARQDLQQIAKKGRLAVLAEWKLWLATVLESFRGPFASISNVLNGEVLNVDTSSNKFTEYQEALSFISNKKLLRVRRKSLKRRKSTIVTLEDEIKSLRCEIAESRSKLDAARVTETDAQARISEVLDAISCIEEYKSLRPNVESNKMAYTSLLGLHSFVPTCVTGSTMSFVSSGISDKSSQNVVYETTADSIRPTVSLASGGSSKKATSKYGKPIALYLDACIELQARKMQTTEIVDVSHVPEHMQAYLRRVGRLDVTAHELQVMVKRYNAKLHSSDGGFMLSVDFEGEEAKLQVDFDLSLEYPTLPLDVELHLLHGCLDFDKLRMLLKKNVKPGFGNLLRTCDLIRAYCGFAG